MYTILVIKKLAPSTKKEGAEAIRLPEAAKALMSGRSLRSAQDPAPPFTRTPRYSLLIRQR